MAEIYTKEDYLEVKGKRNTTKERESKEQITFLDLQKRKQKRKYETMTFGKR